MRSSSGYGFSLEAIEPRLLLSADPAVTQVANLYEVTFGNTDDTVGVELASTSASANGGVIVDVTYIDNASVLTKVTLGNATDGVLGLTINGLGGNDKFTVDALGVPLTIHGGAGGDTLIGPDADTSWSISGVNGGSATASGLTFDGMESLTGRSGVDTFSIAAAGSVEGQIDGGDGIDTLIGPNTDNSWIVSALDAGTLNAGATSGFAAFSGVEKITGGTAKDLFIVQSNEGISQKIDGSGGTDTLIGPDADNIWTLTGVGSGSLNAVAGPPAKPSEFAGIENLTGGSKDDEFKIGAGGSLSGVLDGGVWDVDAPTVNTLDYSQRGAAVTVNLNLATATGLTAPSDAFSRITKVVGSSSASLDTLIGPFPSFDQTKWTITGVNSGTVDDWEFVSFESLTGQNNTNDAFIISGGSVSGTVSGGTGALDGLAVASGGSLVAFQPSVPGLDQAGTFSGVSFAGMDPYDPRSGTDVHRVITGTLFDRDLVIAPAGAGQMSASFTGLTFSSGPSSFGFATPTGSLTLNTGTGSDDIIASLDPNFAGALLTYSDGTLTATLTAGADTVVVSKTAVSDDDGLQINLTVNGVVHAFGSPAAGVKSIVLQGMAGNDSFSLDEVLLIDNVSVDGGTGTDTLFGANAGMEWDVTGPNSGTFSGLAGGTTSFTDIENLRGRAGVDQFNIRDDASGTGSISGEIDGGAGLDELIGPDVNNVWRLTGAIAGVLEASGTNIDTDFVAIENLTGGSAADEFRVIGAAASLSGLLDGGLDKAVDPLAANPVAAIDTLDLSQRGAAASVNLALATVTGIISEFSRIDSIVGSSLTGDTLIGPDAEEVLDPNTTPPLAILSPGTRVLVSAGGSDNIYQYIGPELEDSDPNTVGNQTFDLATQAYTNTLLWTIVDDHINWTVTGHNAGEVEGTAFSGFENLSGRGATSDYFLFEATGSLSGTVAGGANPGVDTTDAFAVSNGTTTFVFVPS
ncbi:MAG TPA: LEPR-XLL domain-containing protein, partial [Terriglobia bacterium]|nr:LEPR-XLL domain-containing protein [Terriglobia bacterium]